MDEGERQRFSGNIVTDAERLTRLVRRLLELARAESLGASGEAATLAAAAEGVPQAGPLKVRIGKGAQVAVRMSAENLAMVLSNLADNSLRHGATLLTLEATRSDGQVVVTVADDGTGISPNNRDRIFEPFFTTRRDTGGTGMGLGIVVALLKAHDGRIRLVDSERGARFEITLPAA
jgi:signal transduction histidine kinase